MPSKNSDDFTEKTKQTLAKRVNLLCSNPNCRKQTSGPHSDPNKATTVGEAAHIAAAALGGARYDQNMTPEQRKSPDNGIWLCSNCSELIDKDEDNYPVELINQWKLEAEERANQALRASGLYRTKDYIDQSQANMSQAISTLPQFIGTKNVQYRSHIPMLDIPPLVEKAAKRNDTVNDIYNSIQHITWVSIQGDYGCGKTQLVVLITQQFNNIIGWLSLRDCNFEEAAKRIDEMICFLVESCGTGFRQDYKI